MCVLSEPRSFVGTFLHSLAPHSGRWLGSRRHEFTSSQFPHAPGGSSRESNAENLQGGFWFDGCEVDRFFSRYMREIIRRNSSRNLSGQVLLVSFSFNTVV